MALKTERNTLRTQQSSPIKILEQTKRYSSVSTPKKKILSVSVTRQSTKVNASNVLFRNFPTKSSRMNLEIVNPVVRKSSKACNAIKSYGVSTHHGIRHVVNEDKISIHLSKLCFFSLFDGYSGAFSSEFLKEKLVTHIMQNQKEKNIEKLINQAFITCQQQLLEAQKAAADKSGSSAIVCLISQQNFYVANVGTSLAIGKSNGRMVRLSKEHTCQNISQYARITSLKRRLFQTKVTLKSSPTKFVQGPLRIHPYGLTVTRTLGNLAVKIYDKQLGQPVVLPKPQIKYANIVDFNWIILCSEGLTTVITDEQLYAIVENSEYMQNDHEYVENCVRNIMKRALLKGCCDNFSVIMIILNRQKERPTQQPVIIKGSSLKYIGKHRIIQE